MSNFQLRKAERRQVKLRIGVSGPSGSGKTMSSLKIAKGIAGSWDKVCLIDTENKSGDLYANLGAYQVITLEPPFSPERYIDAIHAAEDAGMEVIILDSATHEWDGTGGILEYVDSLGGRYQDWAKATPRHRKFIDTILNSPCYVITTMRSKQDYAMDTDAKGKVKVQKLGMKEVQREGFEYELTLNFSVDINHLAKASKDRTGLFMDRPEFLITEETGKEILEWNKSGAEVPPDYTVIKRRIMTEAKRLGMDVYAKDFQTKVKDHTGHELGPETYEKILDALSKMKELPKAQMPADKPQDPPAAPPIQPEAPKQPEKTPEQLAEEQRIEQEKKDAARAAAEKISQSELTVLKSLLHQKEGIAINDEKNQLGYLGLVHDINIKAMTEITRDEFRRLHQVLLAQKSKE